MKKFELDSFIRRLYLVTVSSCVLILYFLNAFIGMFILRFDAEMIRVLIYSSLITTVVALPPALLAFVPVTNRLKRVLRTAFTREDGEPGADDTRLLAVVDDYPRSVAMIVFPAIILAVFSVDIIFRYWGGLNISLCLVFLVLGLSVALAIAYTVFFVLYIGLGFVRRKAYKVFNRPGYQRGANLRTRIVLLPLLLALVMAAMGWGIAVSGSFFQSRDEALERKSERLAALALVTGGTGADIAPGGPVSGGEALLLVDGAGVIVEELEPGEGLEEDTAELILRLVREKKESLTDGEVSVGAVMAPAEDSLYYVLVFEMPDLDAHAGSLTYRFLLTIAFMIPLTYGLTKLTADSITGPLGKLKKVSDRVADGDLTVNIDVSSSDEIGRVGNSFTAMIASLHQISLHAFKTAEETSESAAGVSTITGQTQASIEQFTRVIEHLAENAAEEARMAGDIHQLAGEIFEALEQGALQADSGVEVSRDSSHLAEDGLRDARVAEDRMAMVGKGISDTAQIIRRLGEQTGEIGIIVDVIRGIADQTNLLALNAAIEAARAQEHGRGFSVVAEEVKKLAEESARSSGRISALVKEIQKSTSAAVEMAEKGNEDISSGMEAVRITGQTLEKIFEYVKKAEGLSSAIAGNMQVHLELGRRIQLATRDIDSIAEQNSASSTQIAAAAEEQTAAMQELSSTSFQLASLAQSMREATEQFKL